MPLLFYPDTNTIHLIRSTWTPAQFDSRASALGFTLCIGHQSYELARSFLHNHSQRAVQDTFAFLAEIECIDYLPNVNASIAKELYLAKTGLPIITVVGPLNRTAVKFELLRLARGSAHEARRFIARRESNIAKDKKRITQLNQESARKAELLDPSRANAIKTFERLQEELATGRAGWLHNFSKRKGHKVPLRAVERILADPARYPLLNTIVSSQEYLYFITAFQKSEPGKDTLDDFRHLVESSICDLFVTNDLSLIRQAEKICPYKPTWTWESFKSHFAKELA
jgi:hypothetical protein